MFATKKDAQNWIAEFGSELDLEPRKIGRFWDVCEKNGLPLTEDEMAQQEELKAHCLATAKPYC